MQSDTEQNLNENYPPQPMRKAEPVNPEQLLRALSLEFVDEYQAIASQWADRRGINYGLVFIDRGKVNGWASALSPLAVPATDQSMAFYVGDMEAWEPWIADYDNGVLFWSRWV